MRGVGIFASFVTSARAAGQRTLTVRTVRVFPPAESFPQTP